MPHHPLEEPLRRFVLEECQPAEKEYDLHLSSFSDHKEDRWSMAAIPPCILRLQNRAKELGLWNLFLTNKHQEKLRTLPCMISSPSYLLELIPRDSITNADYAQLSEILGYSFIAAEVCNSSAPDTGNMEVLIHYGTTEQQIEYLIPLLQGKIRSSFLMTEPDVASSDATNISTTLTKIYNNSTNKVQYQLNGKKWWSTGAMDPRCTIALVLAKSSHDNKNGSTTTSTSSQSSPQSSPQRYEQHTVVLVPIHYIQRVRPLQVFGYDDAPHGHAECYLNNILLDESSILYKQGKGFEIAQSRLGPGRIHHCMRAIGIATRCYHLMMDRLITSKRQTFGLYLYQHGVCMEQITDSYQDLLIARLLTLHCAKQMDENEHHHHHHHFGQQVRQDIALIKVAVPHYTFQVVDRAIQIYGAAGLCQDTILPKAYCSLRSLRIADGPDAVHKRTIALMEISK